MTQHWFNVVSTSWRWINVKSILSQRCVPAGVVHSVYEFRVKSWLCGVLVDICVLFSLTVVSLKKNHCSLSSCVRAHVCMCVYVHACVCSSWCRRIVCGLWLPHSLVLCFVFLRNDTVFWPYTLFHHRWSYMYLYEVRSSIGRYELCFFDIKRRTPLPGLRSGLRRSHDRGWVKTA